MGVIYDFIFDNAYQVDAGEAEARLREKYPKLLHPNEHIELAFTDRGGKGRDKEFFTTHRLLIKDGKGIGSKRKNYQSIPYSSIQAFSTQTAGKFDGDVEVKIWSLGVPYAQLDLATANVDIYQIQQFLNQKLALHAAPAKGHEMHVKIDPTPPNMSGKQSTATKIIDWFGDNAKQVNAAEAENIFKTEMPVLLANEKIELIFKSGRDYTAFTNYRLMIIDVQGVFGKKIEFHSVLWKTICAYSVQTAGAFLDRDVEMYLFTNMLSYTRIQQDFRKDNCNLFEIQKFLCNHILWRGKDRPPETFKDIDLKPGHVDQKGFWWFRDNQRPLDAVEIDRQYHQDPPLLVPGEQVEMAFKGHRDVTLFTNLRVVVIDPKGLVGKKIEYTSLPWESIMGHTVRTAGKYFDWDAEVGFATEMEFYPGQAGIDDSPPIPARPEQSYFEIDFNPNVVDMNALNYYLSRRLLLIHKMDVGAPIPMAQGSNYERPTSTFEKILEYIGDDRNEIDPNEIDQQLHNGTRILLDDEKVLMAFKAGRDMTLFTSLRILSIDVQGLSGQKVEYSSLPYKSIRSWAVETAGTWDTDTELKLYTKNRWHFAKIEMDFRTGRCDIAQINYFLSALIVGLPTDGKIELGKKNYNSGNREANPIKAGSFGILGNSWEIDSKEIESKLRSDPCLLLENEKVLRAFQSGRDIDVYTERRLIIIDTKGLSGKRVKYKSYPWKFIRGFEFETAGHLDRDAEIYLYFEMADYRSHGPPRYCPYEVTKQSLLVKKIDIYEIGKIFVDTVMFGENKDKYEDEPEIALDVGGFTGTVASSYSSNYGASSLPSNANYGGGSYTSAPAPSSNPPNNSYGGYASATNTYPSNINQGDGGGAYKPP